MGSRLVVNVDGGAQGESRTRQRSRPWFATREGKLLERRGEPIGRATNNVAEYRAMLLGISRAAELGASEVELIGDSELVVRQLKGEYKVKHARASRTARARYATRSASSTAGRSAM